MRIFLILIILFLGVSCTSKKNSANKKNYDKIEEVKDIVEIFDRTEYRLNIPDNLIIDQSFGRIKEDINKNIYIPNQDGSLFKFDSNYNYLGVLKRVGPGPEEYDFMIEYEIDSDENIYIYDLTKFKILKYDKNHKFIASHKCKNYNAIKSINFYNNNLYCVFSNGEIHIYDTKFNLKSKKRNYDPISEKFIAMSGNIDIFNNNIYSFRPNFYEIVKRDINLNILEKFNPKRSFKQINKKYHFKLNDKNDKGFNGNAILRMYVMNKIIIFTVSKDKLLYTVFDVLDHNGNIIKSKIKGKKFELFNKLDSKTLVKLEFAIENGIIIPKIVKLTLKKEFQ